MKEKELLAQRRDVWIRNERMNGAGRYHSCGIIQRKVESLSKDLLVVTW